MAEKIEGPALVMFTCQCGRQLEALPSAEVRCKCGKQMVREADRAAGKQLAERPAMSAQVFQRF